MPRAIHRNLKQAKLRRSDALRRGELVIETAPRVFPAGPTSSAIKVEDPATRRMIDEFLARGKS